MILEIVTPEAILFTGEVESVAVPGINGEFQMLNNHAPIVSLLQKGEVRIVGDIEIEEDFEEMFTKGE
ncbi:MAG TPA: F0F1 ATP synthase subunit epsilon, partial [Flavobacteriia bacterium]|nr:F0F1 ATP synthase subunit epsilon [Flavobacteriia bacterium]